MNSSSVDVHLSGDLACPLALRSAMQTLHAMCSNPGIQMIRVDLSRITAATGQLHLHLREIDVRLRGRGGRLALTAGSLATELALDDRRLGLGDLAALYFASRPVPA